MNKLMATLTLLLAWASGMISGACAEEASSAWAESDYATSRLFVGGYDAGRNILHLGWQVRLRDGWKTYWRSPGEAGMPPSWTWRQGVTPGMVSVLWPVPERMNFFGYDSNIYHDELVVPVELRLGDGQSEVNIGLTMDFMICKEVCIPLSADYRLEITDPAGLKISPYQAALYAKYLTRVPRLAAPDMVKVVDDGAGRLRVSLSQTEAPGPAFRELFVEGPEEYYFSRPVPVEGADGLLFEIPYTRERDHGGLAGRKITLTLVPASGQALEIHARVSGK